MEKRILLVDDYRPSLEGLRDCLGAAGWQVEIAGDAWQAVRKAKDAAFDVAIVDLDLPPAHGVGISGWDVVRVCRALEPNAAVIVVGASADEGARAVAERLGVCTFLEKPIDPVQLRRLVRALEPVASRAAEGNDR